VRSPKEEASREPPKPRTYVHELRCRAYVVRSPLHRPGWRDLRASRRAILVSDKKLVVNLCPSEIRLDFSTVNGFDPLARFDSRRFVTAAG